ncbi:hypothetical protein SARC_10604 [Sphaeroforma arctica JP610]|uniref:Uncharacterized protein n=1 Tax=Sphaeroforma arctica JP610 TaxID=667725 RepID=A0A0L0FKB8_9EUKA|nr:hypothetical protein SARC_10604 [Sphaeroforma arctica JP610]KNC76921.1 hypothetical protein SARC_10604 [Sphaeroforma arctica JP610]|eukprot:XP_014150823.1 hypothetical protein SARC_10604 [Sphaeroforma arctica JP610]
MQIMDTGAEVVYLYNLVDGTSNLTLADNVARLAGVPEVVLARMRDIIDKKLRNLPVKPIPLPAGLNARNVDIVELCGQFFSGNITVSELLAEVLNRDLEYRNDSMSS